MIGWHTKWNKHKTETVKQIIAPLLIEKAQCKAINFLVVLKYKFFVIFDTRTIWMKLSYLLQPKP